MYLVLVCKLGATGITFDDIPNANSVDGTVPSICGGLSWMNAKYLNATVFAGSGYVFTRASGEIVAWFDTVMTIQALVMTNTFTLTSCVMAAGWSNSLIVTINGYYSTTQLYTITFPLNTYTQTKIVLDWPGVNKVVFTPSGSGYYDMGIDNLCVTFWKYTAKTKKYMRYIVLIVNYLLLLTYSLSTARLNKIFEINIVIWSSYTIWQVAKWW